MHANSPFILMPVRFDRTNFGQIDSARNAQKNLIKISSTQKSADSVWCHALLISLRIRCRQYSVRRTLYIYYIIQYFHVGIVLKKIMWHKDKLHFYYAAFSAFLYVLG